MRPCTETELATDMDWVWTQMELTFKYGGVSPKRGELQWVSVPNPWCIATNLHGFNVRLSAELLTS